MTRDGMIRPPILGRVLRLGACILPILLFLHGSLHAQRPQFRKWNAGVAIGVSPINSESWLPTLRGHFGRWTAEVSPYPFSIGGAIGYHLPMRAFKQHANVSLDATAYAVHSDDSYYVTFPSFTLMRNSNSGGLLAGASIYFLKRMSLQAMFGLDVEALHGEAAYNLGRGTYVSLNSALSLDIRLFKTFAE